MKIAVGNSRMDKKWKNKDITWEDFISLVKSTIRTTETVSEFRKMSRAQQDSIKDVGGFVGGALREGKRRNGYVLSRSLLTLDMDYAKPEVWEQIEALHDFKCCTSVNRVDTKNRENYAADRYIRSHSLGVEYPIAEWIRFPL